MTAHLSPTRRRVIGSALAAGCGVTFLSVANGAMAQDLARKKLVVIIQRGACDGLSLAPPVGDPDYYGLRKDIAIPADKALPIDGQFALHPKLARVHALMQAGQARIVPAAAIPQRIRSTSRRRTFWRPAAPSSTPPPPAG